MSDHNTAGTLFPPSDGNAFSESDCSFGGCVSKSFKVQLPLQVASSLLRLRRVCGQPAARRARCGALQLGVGVQFGTVSDLLLLQPLT